MTDKEDRPQIRVTWHELKQVETEARMKERKRCADIAEKELREIARKILITNREPEATSSAAFHMHNALQSAAPRIRKIIMEPEE